MLFILLILVYNISVALESISFKYLYNRKTDVVFGVCFWAFVFLSIIACIMAGLNFEQFNQNLNSKTAGYIFMTSCLSIGKIFSWYSALTKLNISIVKPLTQTKTVLLAIFSWILFGDKLTIIQIVLISLITAACACLAFTQGQMNSADSVVKQNEKKKNFKLGMVFLSIWIAISTVSNLLQKHIMNTDMHFVTYEFFYHAFDFLIILAIVLFINKGRISSTVAQVKNKWYIVIGLTYTVSGLIWVYIIKNQNLGLILALFNISTVLLVLSGRYFFKEKISWQMYAFICVILVSSILLNINI